MFRMGAEAWSWPRRVRRTIEFGLIHAVIGIPIGDRARTLVRRRLLHDRVPPRVPPHRARRRRPRIESTRAHTAYNLSILSLVLVLAVWTAVVWLRGG